MGNLSIDPTPRATLSPALYMQFMEPLGSTDSSVAAAWDPLHDRWRPEFLDCARQLAPGAIRWGGILTSYWKWREGIGPRESRRAMPNLLWGGIEPNQVGVHEILDLCVTTGAEPIMAVNFAADGRPEYLSTALGENRAGTAEEAADLIRYCNDPDHAERRANGRPEPWSIRYWQVGNETSYPPPGQRFDAAENARTFKQFARAMRAADPGIRLIGWGDREGKDGAWWIPALMAEAGDDVDLAALHMMHQRPRSEDSLLAGERYRRDYDAAWSEMDAIYETVRSKLAEARETLSANGSKAKLAITEGHLSLRPHNKCPILREWIAGLYHARIQNLYQRNGDLVEIATLADFFGTTWSVNALMLGSPGRELPYLMPAGKIAKLYRHNVGDQLIDARCDDSRLDIAASRKGDELFLHVVNTDLHSPSTVSITVPSITLAGGEVTTIAPGSPAASVYGAEFDELAESRILLETQLDGIGWTVPAASVSAARLRIAEPLD